MIHDSQGYIADRTCENLTATDAGVVHFRKMMLAGMRALGEGTPPSAARNAKAYHLRSGSWIADKRFGFEEIMMQRFGDPMGHVKP